MCPPIVQKRGPDQRICNWFEIEILYVNIDSLYRYHDPERINKFVLDLDESIPVPFNNHFQSEDLNSKVIHQSRQHSRSSDMLSESNQRTRSLSRERLTQNEDQFMPSEQELGLSRKSKLNERYLKNTVSNEGIQLSETSKLNQRYISIKSEERKDIDVNVKSKKRNIHSKTSDKKSKLDNKRSISMQELGLASSALNDRYFSRNDLHKTASLTEGSDSGQEAPNKILSLSTFKEENTSSTTENLSKSNRTNMSSRPLPAEPDNENTSQNVSSVKKTHLTQSHLIRPSSRSSSSSISSEISSADRETDFQSIENERNGEELSEFNDKSNEQNSRFQKYGTKLLMPSNTKHSMNTKTYIDRSVSRDSEYQLVRGSAMSDTSESPSLASHVRNIRIPSHTSELDQYLDDLFNPVLDANLDELSDARSLAASIKGGAQPISGKSSTFSSQNQKIFCEDIFDLDIKEFEDLFEANKLVSALKGGGKSGSEVCLSLIHIFVNFSLIVE